MQRRRDGQYVLPLGGGRSPRLEAAPIRIDPSDAGGYWVITFRATNLSKERLDLVTASVTVEGTDGAPMGESTTVGFEHINPGQYQVGDQQWAKRGPIGRVLVNLTYPSDPGADRKLAVRSLIPGISIVRQ